MHALNRMPNQDLQNPSADEPVLWTVLGTANIAAHAFLPAMRATGATAVAVGSREPSRATAWAKDNSVASAFGYQEAIETPAHAIYIALPNTEHVYWAKAAVSTGRAVLCEKPIGITEADVSDLISVCGPETLLWESFVFLFHPQTALIQSYIDNGAIGDLSEIISEFHFLVDSPGNIRLQSSLAGGALNDVGCYPIRLARLLFGAEPDRASARSFQSKADGSGVDLEVAGICDFPALRRLVFSAGLRRPMSTHTRIIGSTGELRVSNPFHPRAGDTVELVTADSTHTVWTNDGTTAFQYAIEHIGEVVRRRTRPRHLAIDDALKNARALDMMRAAMAMER